MEVYTGLTSDGRFLNGAELTCLMATRLVAFCLLGIGNRCLSHKGRCKFYGCYEWRGTIKELRRYELGLKILKFKIQIKLNRCQG